MGKTFSTGLLTNGLWQDASNNIGIGGSPSGSYKLEVTGTAKVSTSLLVNDISISSSTMQASGNYYIGCNNANFIQFYTSNTDRMAITAAGNVLIGTTTDAAYATLQVQQTYNSGYGGIRLTNTTGTWWTTAISAGGNYYFNYQGSGVAYITSAGAATFSSSVSIPSSTGLILGQTSVTDGIISSVSSTVGLNFKIGTTSALYINGSATPTIGIGNTGSSSYRMVITGIGSTSATYALRVENGGTYGKFVVRDDGDINMAILSGSGTRTVTADASGSLSTSSDSSLKQEDTSHKIEGLAEILQLKPRAYKWLSDIEIRGEEATTEIGFFANEVAPIIPSAAPKTTNDLYGFYDRAVIAALVKAIQELSAQNQDLKSRLDKAGL